MFNPVNFIKETQIELKKVTWTGKEKTIQLTGIVIIVSLFVSVYLGFLDFAFSELLALVLKFK